MPFNINVPIEFDGEVDCIGVKLGGNLQKMIKKLSVTCLPEDMPSEFTVNVTEMNIKDVKRVKDVSIPDKVRLRANSYDIVVQVLKR